MSEGAKTRKVIGIRVEGGSSKRTVRMRLVFEGDEVLIVEMPLSTATRLTDELIDAEFIERCPPGMGPLSHDRNVEDPAPLDLAAPSE